MEPNPYESPAFAGRVRDGRGRGRLAAIVCWAIGTLWALLGIASLLNPVAREVYREQFYFFATVLACTFILPSTSLFLFGLASWRRSSRLAIAGAALLVPTIVLYGYRFLFFWG